MQSNSHPPERQAFSIQELATAWGVSRPTIYKAINNGALPTFQIGGRRLISRDAARAYIAAGERAPIVKRDVSAQVRARRAASATA